MKKTKKALLAAIACSAVLAAGAFGLAACSNGNSGNNEPPATHEHNWGSGWTVTDANKPEANKKGKATRTCSGAGECDAATADKEYELPELTVNGEPNPDYVKGKDTATCSATGTQTYTYNKDGVNVSFSVATPKNTEHKYKWVNTDPTGHYQVCEYDETHTTENGGHNTSGANGSCTVCGYDPAHEHTFNEDVWKSDETGHWHEATCNHDVKGSFGEHVYGTWTEVTPATENTEGSETSTCTVEGCGYVGTRPIAKLPKTVTGGNNEANAVTVTAGNYATMIKEVEGEYGSDPDTPYFAIEASEAKTYTLKIDSAGLLIVNGEQLWDKTEYKTVVEAGDKFVFAVSISGWSVSDTVNGDKVTFSVTESDPPAVGTLERPVFVNADGNFGKETEDEDEKVYFKLDHNKHAGRNVKVTLGAGVRLYFLGYNLDDIKDGTAEVKEVTDGLIAITVNVDAYLYAEARNGDCYADFEVVVSEGDKEKPITAKFGTGEENQNAVEGKKWFKVQSATAGKYIVKADNEDASFELYTSQTATTAAASGNTLLVQLEADTPVYVLANDNNYGAFSFTVTEYTEADKGTIASDPIEITQTGDIALLSGTRYYKFTADKNGLLTMDADVSIAVFSDASYDYDYFKASNSYGDIVIEIEEGEIYYIQVLNYENAEGSFNITTDAFSIHDYVVTLTDGDSETALTLADVTVKLFNEDDDVETATPLKTGTTVNGVVTFTGVDSSKEYKLVLEGLPEAYGYYDYYMAVPTNIDETTNFAALVFEKQTYTFTVALPEGAETTDLSGIKVTFDGGIGELVTDAAGTVTFKALDPMKYQYGALNDSYYTLSSIVIPEGCAAEGKYVYVPKRNTDITVSKYSRTNSVTLSAVATYTLTLTDGTNPIAGVTVTVNGETGTTNESGVVTITTTAGAHDIEISGGYITDTKTTLAGGAISVVCEKGNPAVTGADSYFNTSQLNLGKTKFTAYMYESIVGHSWSTFTAAEAGTYVIAFTDEQAMFGVDEVYFNGGSDSMIVYNEGVYTCDGTVVTNVVSGYYATSITVVLSVGDFVDLATCSSGTITITKA
ncbi:MAG: Ig-like domain-containing protein [Roseburia sp.]|nr:Ig-like domain-containing protein [Roseburia sp.]